MAHENNSFPKSMGLPTLAVPVAALVGPRFRKPCWLRFRIDARGLRLILGRAFSLGNIIVMGNPEQGGLHWRASERCPGPYPQGIRSKRRQLVFQEHKRLPETIAI